MTGFGIPEYGYEESQAGDVPEPAEPDVADDDLDLDATGLLDCGEQ